MKIFILALYIKLKLSCDCFVSELITSTNEKISNDFGDYF